MANLIRLLAESETSRFAEHAESIGFQCSSRTNAYALALRNDNSDNYLLRLAPTLVELALRHDN